MRKDEKNVTVKTFGYIRVSTEEQNIARQIDTMKALGVDERDIYIDKMSGNSLERPKYQALKMVVREGDTVIFDSITRLSRKMDDIKKEYQWFVANGVNLRFLKEPILNTEANTDDVLKRAISEIVLTILAAFAEKEREDIRIRQREGIEAAKRRGKYLGRPRKSYELMTKEEKRIFEKEYNKWKAGEQTAVQTFRKLGVAKSTFYKIVKEYELIKSQNVLNVNVREA